MGYFFAVVEGVAVGDAAGTATMYPAEIALSIVLASIAGDALEKSYVSPSR
jgi:hypothetical protein